MKKTIVIIILAVYIASIAIVNFFGLEVKTFDGITYVENIQCESITLQNEDAEEIFSSGMHSGAKLFVFDFIPASNGKYTSSENSLLNNPNAVQLNYEVLPHLADGTGVKYEYDEAVNYVHYHEASRSFIFLEPNKIFTVTLKATDGSNKSIQVSIMGRLPK